MVISDRVGRIFMTGGLNRAVSLEREREIGREEGREGGRKMGGHTYCYSPPVRYTK